MAMILQFKLCRFIRENIVKPCPLLLILHVKCKRHLIDYNWRSIIFSCNARASAPKSTKRISFSVFKPGKTVLIV